MTRKTLGFFSRVLDQAPPQERYALLAEQILLAERLGFDSAWVAQHHFDADEGGLPAPLVFLASLAPRTSRIRLATGIVTLGLESPLRVAEDAAVLDLLLKRRLEIGLGSGGSATAFAAFGLDSDARGGIYGDKLALFLQALRGEVLPGGAVLYPPGQDLLGRLWQATFSVAGGTRAGAAGHGLMLSRTQPRPAGVPLWDVQTPIIDAYLAALPATAAPRIMGSRSLYVSENREEARRFAELGFARARSRTRASGAPYPTGSLDEVIAATDTHVGTVEDVLESLAADTALARATEIVFQVHSVDPPHPFILRSLELLATRVAPALGWAGPRT